MSFNSPPRMSDAEIDEAVRYSLSPLGNRHGVYARAMAEIVDDLEMPESWEHNASKWPIPHPWHSLRSEEQRLQYIEEQLLRV